jgi:hypothetical protein
VPARVLVGRMLGKVMTIANMMTMMSVKKINQKTVVSAGLLLMLGLTILVGCAKEERFSPKNLEPETYLAVADSVRNPTAYNQTLRWWGDDKDGEVVAYEYRWFIDPQEGSCRLDTLWVRTQETSKSFDLPVTHGASRHYFEVRAIDDKGAWDHTACTLTLPVTNSPPEVMIWGVDIGRHSPLPDTTFPAFTAKWHGTDPEGDNTISKYMVWLADTTFPDHGRENAKEFSPRDTVVSLGLMDFNEGYNGFRTLNIIAIDSACDTSSAATYTWYVKEPKGEILVVDDLGKEAGAAERATDRFYKTSIDSCSQEHEEYSVLDLQNFKGTTSAHNFPELFPIFDLVIWYNAPNRSASAHLSGAESALKSHVENGGSILVISMAALGSGPALHDSLWPEVFGIDSIVTRNGSSDFDCNRWTIQANTDIGLASLKVIGIWPGVDCMLPRRPTATPLYYIAAGTAGATEDYYLGILNYWHAGKAVLLTFPLRSADQYGNARNEYCKVINLLLH